jgi:poly-gamma-glutamate capsule biosynthesis protein CapA/YwtB (metallophosphatase superfamily)
LQKNIFVLVFKIVKKLIFRLSQILSKRRKFQPDDLSILLCGDFMLDSRIEPYLAKHGTMYPFKHVMNLISEYDIRALNLETPVSDKPGRKHPNKAFNFRAEPYVAEMIARAGFDYVSLANNHILDFGPDVMSETLKNLDKNGIKYSGTKSTEKPEIIEKNGYKIAFLSFIDSATAPAGFEEHVSVYNENSVKSIRTAAKTADFVIVAMHWGVELDKNANAQQKRIAHEIIDAGATVVWGHHPHVIQETEKYKNGVIFYSMGNFIFSHLSPSITRGMIAGLHIKDGKIIRISEHILNNDNYRVHYAPKIVK